MAEMTAQNNLDSLPKHYVSSAKPPKKKTRRAKLILLGDAYTGKTSLIIRYVRNEFNSNVQATVGSAYISKTVPLTGNTRLTLDIWDTAGQERFRSMNMGLYYRGAVAAIIVYDVTRRESFEGVKRWVEELRKTTGKEEKKGTIEEDGKLSRDWFKRNGLVIALAGNKKDLTAGTTAGGIRGEDLGLPSTGQGVPKRMVTEAEASEFAKNEGMLFFETSAKVQGDEGTQTMFQDVVFWMNVKMEREGIGLGRGDNATEDGERVNLTMPKTNTTCCS